MSVVHPNVKNRIDKKAALLCAEWDMEAFSRCPAAEPRYVDPSRYPGIDVDLTFQVERGVPYADLEKLLRQEDSELLKSHRLTDVYSEEDGRDERYPAPGVLFTGKDAGPRGGTAGSGPYGGPLRTTGLPAQTIRESCPAAEANEPRKDLFPRLILA